MINRYTHRCTDRCRVTDRQTADVRDAYTPDGITQGHVSMSFLSAWHQPRFLGVLSAHVLSSPHISSLKPEAQMAKRAQWHSVLVRSLGWALRFPFETHTFFCFICGVCLRSKVSTRGRPACTPPALPLALPRSLLSRGRLKPFYISKGGMRGSSAPGLDLLLPGHCLFSELTSGSASSGEVHALVAA